MKKIRIKVNGTVPGFHPGQVVEVACDEHGTPLDFQWRRRLRNAKNDSSCEVVPRPPRKIEEISTATLKKPSGDRSKKA